MNKLIDANHMQNCYTSAADSIEENTQRTSNRNNDIWWSAFALHLTNVDASGGRRMTKGRRDLRPLLQTVPTRPPIGPNSDCVEQLCFIQNKITTTWTMWSRTDLHFWWAESGLQLYYAQKITTTNWFWVEQNEFQLGRFVPKFLTFTKFHASSTVADRAFSTYLSYSVELKSTTTIPTTRFFAFLPFHDYLTNSTHQYRVKH
jgi:hypothetical protein